MKLIGAILIFLTAGILNGQEPYRITTLDINSKQNGLMLTIRSDRPIPESNVSAWYAQTGWFYMTILNALSDTLAVTKTRHRFPVLDIQSTNQENSTQIAIKSSHPIEQFEFYYSENPPEILASLRFPVEAVLAGRKEGAGEYPKPVSRNWFLLRSGLYFAGVSLTVAGIIGQDHQDESGWELPAGIGVIAGTWLYDRYRSP